MIKHVVCWKLYENAEGKDKIQNAREITKRLLALKEKIPRIKSIEAGINSEKTQSDNYDVVLIARFNSFEDLDIYQKHPDHQDFVKFVTPLTSDKIAVDFEE